MKKVKLDLSDKKGFDQLIRRKNISFENVESDVRNILKEVKTRGISAVINYSKKYDGFSGSSANIKVSQDEIESATKNITQEIRAAIDIAYRNIKKFHEKQLPTNYETEITKGIVCGRKFTQIENVGLYIPGGTAPLPSTVVMLAIPAKLAGCDRIVLATPSKNNKIDDVILYAAAICGIDEIYKVGGAQAIAMLGYGTSLNDKVDKIFGPGNQYVTKAKMLISNDAEGCAIDMPAGPSEVLIIADKHANPRFIAADYLSQLEHGNDSQAILVTDSESLIAGVEREINSQLLNLNRLEYIKHSLEYSLLIKSDNMGDAIFFSNKYAPEHLIINTSKPHDIFSKVKNAGSVFLGGYTPESAGDYASGTNHSLPTSGFASSYSGLGVESFMKATTYQYITQDGIRSLSDTIITLAGAEGLDAHANAVKVRLSHD